MNIYVIIFEHSSDPFYIISSSYEKAIAIWQDSSGETNEPEHVYKLADEEQVIIDASFLDNESSNKNECLDKVPCEITELTEKW